MIFKNLDVSINQSFGYSLILLEMGFEDKKMQSKRHNRSKRFVFFLAQFSILIFWLVKICPDAKFESLLKNLVLGLKRLKLWSESLFIFSGFQLFLIDSWNLDYFIL